MLNLRVRTRSGIVASTLATITTLGAGVALADDHMEPTFHPSAVLPMAVTDRHAALGIQARAWLVTTGGTLVSKALDVNVGGWTTVRADGVTSGVAAVSWQQGSLARQRVFFARAGRVQQLISDYDSPQLPTDLPVVSGESFSNTDVAAVTFTEGGVTQLAVASIAESGKVCTWTGPATGVLTATCTTSAWADSHGPEISAAVVDGIPTFVYRGPSGQLRRSRRSSGAGYFHQTLPLPPGVASLQKGLASQPSQTVAGAAEIVVIANTGALWLAQARPTMRAVDRWNQLPAMVGTSAKPARAAVALGTSFSPLDSGPRSHLFVRSESDRLLELGSDMRGSFASSSWRDHGTPPSQALYQIAAYQQTFGLSHYPYVIGVAGAGSWGIADLSLHEFTGSEFRDHVRPQPWNVPAIGRTETGIAAANGATVSGFRGGLIAMIAAATRRDNPGPWKVVASQSWDGGEDFSRDLVVSNLAGLGNSQSDPWTAVGPSLDHHLLTLQLDVNNTGPNRCELGTERSLVYRTANTADELAALDTPGEGVAVIARGNLDAGGLVVTDDGARHAAWWNIDGDEIRYARLSGTTVVSNVAVPLAPGPVGLLRDAAGSVFAYRFDRAGGFPQLCRVYPEPSLSDCGGVGAGTAGPVPASLVLETEALSTDPPCRDGRPGWMCFDTARPVSLSADPINARKLYAAYQANIEGKLRVFFTTNSGGSLSSWSTPVQVSPTYDDGVGDSLEQRHDFDPSMTVDASGTIYITYTQSWTSEFSLTNSRNLIAYSVDGGVTWSTARASGYLWPRSLPYDCARGRHSLGEYREGTSFGFRTMHLMHTVTPSGPAGLPSGPAFLTRVWSSRWSLN